MEYKLIQNHGARDWCVVEGTNTLGIFTQEGDEIFIGSLADCYAWIKAKQEGLLLFS